MHCCRARSQDGLSPITQVFCCCCYSCYYQYYSYYYDSYYYDFYWSLLRYCCYCCCCCCYSYCDCFFSSIFLWNYDLLYHFRWHHSIVVAVYCKVHVDISNFAFFTHFPVFPLKSYWNSNQPPLENQRYLGKVSKMDYYITSQDNMKRPRQSIT